MRPEDCVIECVDCNDFLRARPGAFDLLIADAPYNYGQTYESTPDDLDEDKYLAWTRTWLDLARAALKPDGTLVLFYPDEWAADVDVYCRRTLGLARRSWVVWVYTFGVAQPRNFARCHTHVLVYARDPKNCHFDPGPCRVPSARQLEYIDRRANKAGKVPDNVWVLHRRQLEAVMHPDRDAWLESRICGTFRERKAHSPNQLPEPILDRLVLTLSATGDLVGDCFGGTFTAAVAAVRNGRRFAGCDIGPGNCEAGRRRIRDEVGK
jgi:site-specific DNA-methyltransferase (adenine-specific)